MFGEKTNIVINCRVFSHFLPAIVLQFNRKIIPNKLEEKFILKNNLFSADFKIYPLEAI